MLLISPGEKHGPVLLLDCLREIHEEVRAERTREIEERNKNRIPLDDTTDWKVIEGVRDELVAGVASKDAKLVASLGLKLQALTVGNRLEPLGEFEPDDDLAGVAVTLVVMSDTDRRTFLARMSDGWRAVRDAHIAGASQTKLRDLDERIVDLQAQMVVLGLERIDGLESGPVTDIDASIDAIRRSGLLGPLFSVVQHHQGLSPKKARRFGLPVQSTSASTIALGAQSSVAGSLDAMAEVTRTFAEVDMRHAPVLGATSSTTQT